MLRLIIQRDTNPIKLRVRTEVPLIALISIVSFALGTAVLTLSLAKILVPIEAFVVLGSSLLTLGIAMLHQSSLIKPIPLAIVVTPMSKSFRSRYRDKIFVSALLKIEFRRYFMFMNQGPSSGHTALAMLYAYLRRDRDLIRYYANYTPFFANPWVTEHEEPRHVGWVTMSSIAYVHLIDIVLDPKNFAITSLAFRAPVSVIDIPHVYYELEQLSEIVKRIIGEDMKDTVVSKETNIAIVIHGENITSTTICLSLNDIVRRVEEFISKNGGLLNKIHEIPIDINPTIPQCE